MCHSIHRDLFLIESRYVQFTRVDRHLKLLHEQLYMYNELSILNPVYWICTLILTFWRWYKLCVITQNSLKLNDIFHGNSDFVLDNV